MNEYLLSSDDSNCVSFKVEAGTNELAIDKMKFQLRALGKAEKSTEWTLNLIERDEYPELHDTLDGNGPYHQIFVHQCSIDDHGKVHDEDMVWEENQSISFDAGTAGEVAFIKALNTVDDSGTANE